MSKATILIVEDNGILATHLQGVLLRSGYAAPEPVASGEEALVAIAASSPNLVLMDVQLAGALDGVATAEQIRARFNIPVVYLTAFSQAEQLQRAKVTDPYGYLVKPVSERELLATLEIALYRYTTDLRLKESEQRLNLALQGAELGLWDYDLQTKTWLYNPRCAEMLGYQPEELASLGGQWTYLIHPDDLPSVRIAMATHLENRAPLYECEYRMRHKDGDWIWMLDKGKVTHYSPDGQPLRVSGTLLEINERKHLEEYLRRLATTDLLTGVFNRRYLLPIMENEIHRAQRYARPVSLIMLDVDHFKNVNDMFGHEKGDEVLCGITHRIQQRLRHSDVFSRWGGEEFMILAVETPGAQAVALAETLLTALRNTPFPGIGPVTASFGVTQYRPEEMLNDWLKRVDDLVYEAKRTGRNQVRHDASG
jgi:diguanylate cyclase (GGDEF)-like protein/PAS domain S-box-containing protein